MARTASELIKIAEAQLGYREKATNAQLDDFTANEGSGNWTKYARDLYKAGYYNGNKNGYAWCDVFVDWCFWTLCGHNKKEAEAMECQTGTLGAGCTYSAQYYKNAGRYSTTPMVGDQAFFKNYEHTGIVTAVTDTTVSTIEGNSGNRVKRHTYKRNSGTIIGYGHPRYEAEPAEKPTSDVVLVAGAELKLSKEPLYISATASARSSLVSGTYYFWGGAVTNGRIRITNSKSRVGISGQVTGWIAVPQVMVVYKVKAGDTLGKIATAYHITLKELLAVNPQITNPDLIHVGDIIKIPVK